MTDRTKGFVATVVSATFFGFVPMMTKVISSGGGSMLLAALYRFLFSLPVLYIYLKVKKTSMAITKRQVLDIVIITLFGYGGTTILLFSSYDYIPLGMATTIHFTYPVFTILGCLIFLRAKVKLQKIIAVALSFAGILCFYSGGGDISVKGIGLAFISGMTYAFYTVYLKQSSLFDMEPLKLIFYLNAAGSVMMIAFVVATDGFTLDMTATAWIVAVVLAVSTSFLGVRGYQAGVKLIGPESTAILSTFEPITSVIVGILVYSEALTASRLIGCLCILASVVIVARMKE